MSEIVLIGKFGKKILEPFSVNKVTEAMSEEENIINSSEANSDEQEGTEVAEESAA